MSASVSEARAPLGSVTDNKKRSAENATASKKEATPNLSPYKQRMKELEDYRQSNKVLMYLGPDILECIPDKLEELEVEEVEDLEDDVKERAYDTITQQEVDKYLQIMIVDRKLAQNQGEFYNKIMFADPRNNEGDGMIMLNTYSSWCMYLVVQKLLTAAVKEINAAKKRIDNTGTTKNVAVNALNKAFATILACDAMDHWRLDTESPEDCEKVAKKVSKVASVLLWFTDEELGIVDPYSRQAMLTKLESIHQDWNDIGGIKYKNAKNAQGRGRSHAPPPPPAKKLKTTAAVATTTTAASGGSNNERLISFLNAIHDKKKLREKTCVQVRIQSVADPSKSALVVLSGATDMKKMNQICAFITGHSSTFEFHSQKGTCIKGSRIELELEGAKLWLAAKSMGKGAVSQGAAHVEDKQVKVIQVFQGLNTSPTSGLVYDSQDARNIRAFWVNSTGERFEISVQAVIANKCTRAGTKTPMPRLVKHLQQHTLSAKTAFGSQGLYAANRILQGNRQGPQYKFIGGATQSQVKKTHDHHQATPIANEDGTIDVNDFEVSYYWKPQNVATAGLPPSAA